MRYRETQIDRNRNGYYIAMVQDPTDTVWYSFKPIMADTLEGIQELIDDVLDGKC